MIKSSKILSVDLGECPTIKYYKTFQDVRSNMVKYDCVILGYVCP